MKRTAAPNPRRCTAWLAPRSAAVPVEAAADYGLAGTWQVIDPDHEIDVDGTNGQDAPGTG